MKQLALALTVALVGSMVQAEDLFYGVIYNSGHVGFEKKFNGEIVITDTELRIDKERAVGWRGKVAYDPAFAIPLTAIISIDEDVVRRAFLTINTETSDTAEAIRLQVDRKEVEAIVAKLKFAMKKARERAGVK